MEKIIFYEPYFKPQSHNDINETFTLHNLDETLILTNKIKTHLSKKEIKLTTSLLNEIKNFKIDDIDYLVIHNIGCTKRIIFKNLQDRKKIAHVFLVDYYVHDLIQKRKEEMKTYDNLFKVIGLGSLFGIFAYLKN